METTSHAVGPTPALTQRRAFAAALTPMRDGGSSVDLDGVASYSAFLARAGVDGVLALGSTGEGILLSVAERQRVADAYVATGLPVIVHCGAQTTADTVALAAHAAEAGVVGAAVIGPPYFALDSEALVEHFAAAARACAPLPFYVYEFERTSGYAVPLDVVERLREAAPNLAGLKVSDTPFDKVRPYLVEDLDVFIGAESLIEAGLAAGAVGAVSGLASAFPEVVVEAVRSGSSEHAGQLRALIDRYPRIGTLKAIVVARGIEIRPDVRAPLRVLTADEEHRLLAELEAFGVALSAAA
jgi:dihydrodipicolinate synthase/N-acetylneuraminate lyase